MTDFIIIILILVAWVAVQEYLLVRERRLKDAQTKDLLNRLMARNFQEYAKATQEVKVVPLDELKAELQQDIEERGVPVN
jgi:signal transduction histidine kinase